MTSSVEGEICLIPKRRRDDGARIHHLQRKKLKAKAEKFHLLKVVPEKDKKKWRLPEELADFCNENANKFKPDKDQVDTVTGDLPEPTNIVAVPKMDDFIASMLSTKGKNVVVDKDKDFIRIQNKIRDVMGPLTAAWKDIELFRTGQTDESIQVDVLADQLQKSIIVLGHTSCAVTYQLSSLVKFTYIKTARSL